MYKALQNAIDLKNNKKITDGPWVALSGYWSKFEAILHEFSLRVLIAFRTCSGLLSVPQCVIYQVWVLVMTCKKVGLSYLSSNKFATMLKFYFGAAPAKSDKGQF